MSSTPSILWDGESGIEYRYWIYALDESFQEKAGNYIFVKETTERYSPIYIGQTKNLNQRLGSHENEKCAIRNGATHIHAHVNDNEQMRKSEEKDLIIKWKPICNDQLVD